MVLIFKICQIRQLQDTLFHLALPVHIRTTDGTSVQELATSPVTWGAYHHVAVVVDRYFDTATYSR